MSSTVIPLEIHDCPGNVALETLEVPLKEYSSLVFVIDIQVRPLFSLHGEPGMNLWNYLGPVPTTYSTFRGARDSGLSGEPRNESGGLRPQGRRIVGRV